MIQVTVYFVYIFQRKQFLTENHKSWSHQICCVVRWVQELFGLNNIAVVASVSKATEKGTLSAKLLSGLQVKPMVTASPNLVYRSPSLQLKPSGVADLVVAQDHHQRR